MTPKGKKAPIGQLLVEAGALGEDQLARALERQRMQPGRLGRHLLELGFVGEGAIADALALQSGLPPYRGKARDVQKGPAARLAPSMAKKWRICPVDWDERRGELTLAVADPVRLDVLDDVRFASGAKRVSQRIGPELLIEALIARIYDGVEPPGEEERAESPLVPGGFQLATGQGASSKPREKGIRKRGRAVVADTDRKRARALGSLLEASNWEVARASTPEEAARSAGEGVRIWAHRDFPGADAFLTAIVYDDPAESLADALTVGASLASEACSLARAVVEAKGGEAASLGGEAAGLLRLMGARRGLGQTAVAALEIKTWRAALEGFELPGFSGDYPGRELLIAATAYFRTLLNGGSRHEAARAVREDQSLDVEASTLLLRWALGADLVGRMGRAGRVLALSADKEPLASLAAHLDRTGWEVEKAGEWEEGEWDCVVATLGRGLTLLEGWSHGGQAGRPPVFLVSEAPSGPDTMYAIRLGAEDVFEPGIQVEVVEAKMQRAIKRAGAEVRRTVTGNLKEMGFADLMQVLSNGSRTCVLKIDGPPGVGTVALRDGAVTDARTPEKTGAEAFYEMVGWTEGRFEILPDAEPPGRSVEGESTEGLLMEGFRLLDESRRQL